MGADSHSEILRTTVEPKNAEGRRNREKLFMACYETWKKAASECRKTLKDLCSEEILSKMKGRMEAGRAKVVTY